jgi:hypothetical protein
MNFKIVRASVGRPKIDEGFVGRLLRSKIKIN